MSTEIYLCDLLKTQKRLSSEETLLPCLARRSVDCWSHLENVLSKTDCQVQAGLIMPFLPCLSARHIARRYVLRDLCLLQLRAKWYKDNLPVIAKQMWEEMRRTDKKECNDLFFKAVDLNDYADYLQHIENPMDLTSLR